MFIQPAGQGPIPTPRSEAEKAIDAATDAALMKVAQDVEASFLSEMLRHAGLGEARDSFGGGIGEEQFSSFLRDMQAQEMVHSGGLGLAENLFRALKRHQNE